MIREELIMKSGEKFTEYMLPQFPIYFYREMVLRKYASEFAKMERFLKKDLKKIDRKFITTMDDKILHIKVRPELVFYLKK